MDYRVSVQPGDMYVPSPYIKPGNDDGWGQASLKSRTVLGAGRDDAGGPLPDTHAAPA